MKKKYMRNKVAQIFCSVLLSLGPLGCSSDIQETDETLATEDNETEIALPTNKDTRQAASSKGSNIEHAMVLWDKDKHDEAIKEVISVNWQNAEPFSTTSVFD